MRHHAKPFRPPLLLICASVVLLRVDSASAATYHVAQEMPQAGDDSNGSLERPWKTVSKAAEQARPGDLVIIHGGIYRERVAFKTSGTSEQPIRFEAAPGEHVVLTGADRLIGWRKPDDSKPVYQISWPHKFIAWNPGMTHPNDEYHRTIGRCEQVMVNGYPLRQVLNSNQISPGTFFADVTNKALLVWDTANRDLNKTYDEASVRQEIVRVEGDHVELRGLHFRYAANMAQHGAVVLAGHFDVMEDCTIASMNSSGATIQGEDAVVRRCTFRDNGQLGFGASRAHRLLFSECLVENNNTKDFDRGWEAGGDKLVLCRDAVLERSRFLRNRGNGIWFDIGNTNCTVRDCLIAQNDDAGIFYEISFTLHAHDNVITGNGFATTSGAWGAQAGISLSSSPGCLVERNIIVANREGINFREQLRTTPTIEDGSSHPVWNHNEVIRNNILASNRDAQVWGWFDVKDNRHWPRSSVSPNQPPPAISIENNAEPYTAKTGEGEPQDLSLEKLRLRFENNIYFAAPGQGYFKWGAPWRHHESYAILLEFQSALGIDSGGRTLNPPFAGLRQLDFRLPAGVMSSLKDSYPRGPVPGVSLGL